VNAAFGCGEHRLTYSQRAKTLGQKMVRAASAPSTTTSDPVMDDASSLARKSAQSGSRLA